MILDFITRHTDKERDEETGYDYFGARYYMPLLYHWTKVDPLADKYPNISPYAYCGWNLIKYVDPEPSFSYCGGIVVLRWSRVGREMIP